MAECKSCGKTYFSKSCPHCNAELAESVLGKTKKKTFLALIITLLIFASIGLISFLMAEYMTNNKTLVMAKEKERATKQHRERLQREQSRRAQQQKYNYQSKTPQRVAKQERKTTSTYKYKSSAKVYPKYSKSVRLKSDSKITIGRDNRLKSNAPIYGTYNSGLFIKPICKKKDIRDTHLYNECYITTLPSQDKLYFKKSWVNEFANYSSSRNKKIECDYSKKHGIMHDCKIWNG